MDHPNSRSRLRTVLIVLALAAIAGAIGYYVSRAAQRPAAVQADLAQSGWSCPMHPDYVSGQPGNCPICGMELVRTSTGQMVSHSDQFHVAPQAQRRIGVVWAPVESLTFQPSFTVPAQVVADERRAVSLSPKVEGWIRRLGVSVVGQSVRKGQMLFEIYSPELQQRQRDYLGILSRRDALQSKSGSMAAAIGSSAPDLMMASVARERFLQRSRLAAADVPESVLSDLDRIGRVHDTVPVLAEHDGVVTSIAAREGAFVMPSQTVLGYADLGVVWAELILAPQQLGLIGARARATLRAIGEPTVVETVSLGGTQAVVDPVSHVARLRVPLQSRGSQFRAGTLIEADIQLPGRKALVVRKDSVIRTGHGDFVIVADGGDHFRQVAVRLGAETREEVEVVDGLAAGQDVVVNGQFLLGSEASLQASRQRMAAPGAMDGATAQ